MISVGKIADHGRVQIAEHIDLCAADEAEIGKAALRQLEGGIQSLDIGCAGEGLRITDGGGKSVPQRRADGSGFENGNQPGSMGPLRQKRRHHGQARPDKHDFIVFQNLCSGHDNYFLGGVIRRGTHRLF